MGMPSSPGRPTAARIGVWCALALLLTPLAGCGNDDDDKPKTKAVDGTFVGKLPTTGAFMSVVAAPAAGKQKQRAVTIYICDARRLCVGLAGSVAGDSYTATSEAGDIDAKGTLSDDATSGTVMLPGGKSARYKAGRATAAAGLYDLKLASDGKLSGASAAGVALKGTAALPAPGNGTIKLADGKSLKFLVTSNADDATGLRAGQVRLIVLPGGQLRGAGKRRGGTGSSSFFVRSVPN